MHSFQYWDLFCICPIFFLQSCNYLKFNHVRFRNHYFDVVAAFLKMFSPRRRTMPTMPAGRKALWIKPCAVFLFSRSFSRVMRQPSSPFKEKIPLFSRTQRSAPFHGLHKKSKKSLLTLKKMSPSLTCNFHVWFWSRVGLNRPDNHGGDGAMTRRSLKNLVFLQLVLSLSPLHP